jgi:hypothetical protein
MKSYVTLETKVCPICGKEEDSGAILMDTRIVNGKLRDTFEHRTATGWDLCAEHRALYADGYVALVECSNEPGSNVSRMNPEDAVRTGRIVHLKLPAADALFNFEGGAWPRMKDGKPQAISFVQPGVVDLVLRWSKAQGVEPISPENRPPPYPGTEEVAR